MLLPRPLELNEKLAKMNNQHLCCNGRLMEACLILLSLKSLGDLIQTSVGYDSVFFFYIVYNV